MNVILKQQTDFSAKRHGPAHVSQKILRTGFVFSLAHGFLFSLYLANILSFGSPTFDLICVVDTLEFYEQFITFD
jgi:hypothetical protein